MSYQAIPGPVACLRQVNDGFLVAKNVGRGNQQSVTMIAQLENHGSARQNCDRYETTWYISLHSRYQYLWSLILLELKCCQDFEPNWTQVFVYMGERFTRYVSEVASSFFAKSWRKQLTLKVVLARKWRIASADFNRLNLLMKEKPLVFTWFFQGGNTKSKQSINSI